MCADNGAGGLLLSVLFHITYVIEDWTCCKKTLFQIRVMYFLSVLVNKISPILHDIYDQQYHITTYDQFSVAKLCLSRTPRKQHNDFKREAIWKI